MSVFVEMIGGELYIMNDDYYQLYYNTLTTMYNIAKENNIPFSASLISNLLLDTDHLQKFINLYQKVTNQGISVEIVTSFDLWGRFKSEEALNQWWNNFQKLGEVMTTRPQVEMVLSKPSIDLYMQDADIPEMKVFNQILEHPEKYMFFFENYVPNNPENIKHVPSNEEKINLHKKLIDKYSDKLDFLQAYVTRDIDVDIELYDTIKQIAEFRINSLEKEKELLKRVGSNKSGYWKIIDEK